MPGRFLPIPFGTDAAQQQAMINKNFAELDHENITKVFNGSNGGVAQVQGQLRNGSNGLVFYDSSGNARIFIGHAPNDGRPGMWISDDGQDVLELLEA